MLKALFIFRFGFRDPLTLLIICCIFLILYFLVKYGLGYFFRFSKAPKTVICDDEKRKLFNIDIVLSFTFSIVTYAIVRNTITIVSDLIEKNSIYIFGIVFGLFIIFSLINGLIIDWIYSSIDDKYNEYCKSLKRTKKKSHK